MYTAPLLALGLFALLAYRSCVKSLERRHHRKDSVPLLGGGDLDASPGPSSPLNRGLLLIFHYYTPLFVGLAWLTFQELSNTYTLLKTTDFLDPAKLREAFADEKNLPDWWGTELQYTLGDTGYLRKLSLLSPIFVVLTFFVTLLNTARTVYRVHIKGGGINAHPGHDSAIIIIALPVIYSLLAFKSVGRMWQISCNMKTGPLADIVDFDGNHSWLGRLVMCQLMYKTNFMVADVYEAMALFQFAWLTLSVMSSQRLKKVSEDREKTQKGIESLTNQGIYLFIFSCLLEAGYFLFTTSVEFYIGAPALQFTMAVQRIKEQVHFFFLGCGTIASSAAIGNVVTVELTFHELLEQFHPSSKFWSTKILVSIAFLQTLLMYIPPLNTMSVTEGNMFYASLLTIECFGVSLLHWVAWNPTEGWYEDLRKYLLAKRGY